jgi:stage II sporulation protein AB (anti-sigma F factor)
MRLIANNDSPQVARGTISVFLENENPSVEEIGDIRCSINEAIMNCVMHAYKQTTNKNYIYISARLYENGEFSIEISDNGCGFDTTQIVEHEDKVGFVIMRNFMDSVDIKSKIGKGTTVLMRKRLMKRGEAEE